MQCSYDFIWSQHGCFVSCCFMRCGVCSVLSHVLWVCTECMVETKDKWTLSDIAYWFLFRITSFVSTPCWWRIFVFEIMFVVHQLCTRPGKYVKYIWYCQLFWLYVYCVYIPSRNSCTLMQCIYVQHFCSDVFEPIRLLWCHVSGHQVSVARIEIAEFVNDPVTLLMHCL